MHPTRREFLKTTGLALAATSVVSHSLHAQSSAPMPSADLCFTAARDLARMIRDKKISAREVMAAHLAQINRINPKINAIVAKLADAKCLALADETERKTPPGDALRSL